MIPFLGGCDTENIQKKLLQLQLLDLVLHFVQNYNGNIIIANIISSVSMLRGGVKKVEVEKLIIKSFPFYCSLNSFHNCLHVLLHKKLVIPS